ncbi:MAG: hypothetical protein NTY61_00135 [Candidatus Parcubacteria bacterium]|nr:hypothetical protein [Candidatus Parcubacteria bacterium]
MDKHLQILYRDIKTIKIQGATAIAKAMISGLKDYGLNDNSELKNWQRQFGAAAKYLISARPTEPMAQNGVKFILQALKNQRPTNIVAAKTILRQSANQFIFLLDVSAQKIIKNGQSVIKNGDDVLTHCHSWLAEQIIIKAKKSGKKFRVFNNETRPLYQGHIMAKKLLAAHVDITMVTDSSAGFLISRYSGQKLMIEKIIIGADAILSNGSVVNKIGSHGIAASAFLEKVPFYVASSLFKFYHHSQIKIEQRPAKEIWPQAPKKLKILDFAFDMVPAPWITGIICEAGIIKPKDVGKYVKKIYPQIL